MSMVEYRFIGPYEILEKIDSFIVGDISSHSLRRWAEVRLHDKSVVHEEWLCDDVSSEEKYELFWNVLYHLSRIHGTRSELKIKLNNWATLLIKFYKLLPEFDLDSLD